MDVIVGAAIALLLEGAWFWMLQEETIIIDFEGADKQVYVTSIISN